MQLRGSTVLLTGAAGGIGGHIAMALHGAGARLVLSDRDEPGLTRVRARVGGDASTVTCDLRDLEAAEGLAARAEAAAGHPVDGLVNCAAIEFAGAFTAHTRDELDAITTINVAAPMVLIRSVLPGMLERRRGHVVTVASISGKGPSPYLVAYATTKAAMIEMTRSLRLEYRDEPVSFSSVNPGFVSDAGMYARMEAAGDKAPLALGTSKPGRVASAVVDVIEHDRAERNVATRPMRPLFALTELLPAIGDAGVRAAGGRRFLRSVGRTRGRL
jgi:short-subunit dehydrogenase